MPANLTGPHLIIILVIVLLLFGAPKLPGLARSIGQSMRIFRSEVKTMKDEGGEDKSSSSADSNDSSQSSDSTPPKL
ncbi:MAG: Sec-independent protein translocase subunit TatA [Rhodoglobus sp.]